MKNNPVQILLILGSSKENGNEIIKKAALEISQHYFIKKQSEIIKTASYGVDYTDYFFNQAIIIEHPCFVHSLLKKLQKIERNFGQKRKNQLWGDRILDIDIIFIENLTYYDSQISIPHEGIYTREFVKELIEMIGWENEKLQ